MAEGELEQFLPGGRGFAAREALCGEPAPQAARYDQAGPSSPSRSGQNRVISADFAYTGWMGVPAFAVKESRTAGPDSACGLKW
jgi:hypothetical protein